MTLISDDIQKFYEDHKVNLQKIIQIHPVDSGSLYRAAEELYWEIAAIPAGRSSGVNYGKDIKPVRIARRLLQMAHTGNGRRAAQIDPEEITMLQGQINWLTAANEHLLMENKYLRKKLQSDIDKKIQTWMAVLSVAWLLLTYTIYRW